MAGAYESSDEQGPLCIRFTTSMLAFLTAASRWSRQRIQPFILNQALHYASINVDFEYHSLTVGQEQVGDDCLTDLIWYCWKGKLSPLFGKY